MRVLITGYGPFFSQSYNPSQELLKELDDINPSFSLVTKELPVEFDQIHNELKALKLESFNYILFFGLAGSRSKLTVEKLALNIKYCPERPDNAGVSFESPVPVNEGDALVLESSFACEELNEFLNHDGIPSELSFHGGTYVCNTTLYEGLSLLGDKGKCSFVHLPKDIDPKKLAKTLINYFEGLQ
jgi:pyroglutamyl-peptidase